ncbi:hypothetical protein [Desulforamulus aeronauticus]|uniref:DUF3887 domain-containing protein n=1 Tax=Desulforamulus aeronauticus DSM 10349 TaxID=1121421 RepID=A0A1M6QU82_9FIRM|nr:hypothetical protein [Desulforamulus aeronauticus]SHK23577.1 hypothetical protein SAMN02745123_01196 [Desulforamulus aeronauticus DSM 10349]
MKRLFMLALLFSMFITGCSSQDGPAADKKVTEQEVRQAVTELVNAINSGNVEVVEKYVGKAGPVAKQLVDKLKNNITLSNVRDISIEGTTAQATVTLEVIPLDIKKDVTLTFNITDVLVLNNPLGLLSILLSK